MAAPRAAQPGTVERPELAAYQRRQVVACGTSRSPVAVLPEFYHGLERAPLGELPVLTKAAMMDNFDQISTDPALRLADLQAYLEQPGAATAVPRPVLGVGHLGQFGPQGIIPSARRVGGGDRLLRPGQRVDRRAGRPRAPGPHGRGQLGHTLAPVLTGRRLGAQPVHPHRTARRRLAASRHRHPAQPLRPDVLVAYASMVRDPGRRADRWPAGDQPARGELLLRGPHRRGPGDGRPGLARPAVQRLRRHRDRRDRRRMPPPPRPAPVRGPGHPRGRQRRLPARPARRPGTGSWSPYCPAARSR